VRTVFALGPETRETIPAAKLSAVKLPVAKLPADHPSNEAYASNDDIDVVNDEPSTIAPESLDG